MNAFHKNAIELVSSALQVSLDKVSVEAKIYSLPEWDSLGQLLVIQRIEEIYKLNIDDANLFEQLTSVSNISNFLSNLKQK